MKIVVVFIGMIVFQDWMISILPVYINGNSAMTSSRIVSQQPKTHGLRPCLFYGYPFERTAGARICSADADEQITGIISIISPGIACRCRENMSIKRRVKSLLIGGSAKSLKECGKRQRETAWSMIDESIDCRIDILEECGRQDANRLETGGRCNPGVFRGREVVRPCENPAEDHMVRGIIPRRLHPGTPQVTRNPIIRVVRRHICRAG